jgi:hypothetical protein
MNVLTIHVSWKLQCFRPQEWIYLRGFDSIFCLQSPTNRIDAMV